MTEALSSFFTEAAGLSGALNVILLGVIGYLYMENRAAERRAFDLLREVMAAVQALDKIANVLRADR